MSEKKIDYSKLQHTPQYTMHPDAPDGKAREAEAKAREAAKKPKGK